MKFLPRFAPSAGATEPGRLAPYLPFICLLLAPPAPSLCSFWYSLDFPALGFQGAPRFDRRAASGSFGSNRWPFCALYLSSPSPRSKRPLRTRKSYSVGRIWAPLIAMNDSCSRFRKCQRAHRLLRCSRWLLISSWRTFDIFITFSSAIFYSNMFRLVSILFILFTHNQPMMNN